MQILIAAVRGLILITGVIASAGACRDSPAPYGPLQEAAGLMASITQHGEGADPDEAASELDAILAQARMILSF